MRREPALFANRGQDYGSVAFDSVVSNITASSFQKDVDLHKTERA